MATMDKSRIRTKLRYATFLAALGIGVGVAVLSLCIFFDLGLMAPAMFGAGLLASGIATAVYFRCGCWIPGAVVLILISTLVQLSFMKWYGPHSAWGETNHRHILWDLGHVH
jgi:predicted Co/Zn/Cd cation transporter (cation efflux family)